MDNLRSKQWTEKWMEKEEKGGHKAMKERVKKWSKSVPKKGQ